MIPFHLGLHFQGHRTVHARPLHPAVPHRVLGEILLVEPLRVLELTRRHDLRRNRAIDLLTQPFLKGELRGFGDGVLDLGVLRDSNESV